MQRGAQQFWTGQFGNGGVLNNGFQSKIKLYLQIEMSGNMEVTYDAINSFIIAIKCCNMEEIKKYLDEYDPIIVNRLETQTRQPSLYFSACLIDHQQSYEIMKLLIEHGANPHFKDNFQQTVLFYVCRDGKQRCLDLLLERGLDLNDADLYGQTPLYYAAKENRINIIHKLIEKKVDLNKKDEIAGQTPLFYAAKEGHLEMCKILVESGCDLTITDTSHKVAAHTAKKFNKMEVYEYLNAQLQALKDMKKISPEQIFESQHHDQKKTKSKKKESIIHSAGPKSQTNLYKLYRADNIGNIMEVNWEDLQYLLTTMPELKAMIDSPDEIDMSQLEEVKGKDAWRKAAFRVLTLCWKAKGGYYFHEPVDPAKFGIDDYFDEITEPMDLGTVKRKLNHNVYENIEEFSRDLNLVFDNCVKYNGPENMIAKHAIEIKGLFEQNMKQMGFMN